MICYDKEYLEYLKYQQNMQGQSKYTRRLLI